MLRVQFLRVVKAFLVFLCAEGDMDPVVLHSRVHLRVVHTSDM